MADPLTESIQRIADARRDAEAELKAALSAVRESDEVAPYLSAFSSFASALFDAEAGELLAVCEDADAFQTAIADEVAPRIVEGILPDHSLKRVTTRRTDEVKRLSIEHDMDTDLLWEVGPDGTRKPARDEVRGVYAQHGDWENFMPKGVRFQVRWPSNNATVRAALCQTLQQRVTYWAGQFQLRSTAGARGARNRLRRVSYPFHYWLYDHTHEPAADSKAELEYWKAHVWRGYHVLIENYERMEMGWADRHEKLNAATAGLSYDLAVLQGNYVIDRGRRGDEAMRTFRDESAELLEEVTSSWRAGCERLAVTFDDATEELKDLAQPFHRVRDDLRRLLADLPPATEHGQATNSEPAPAQNTRLQSTVTSELAARRMEAYLKSNGIGQTEFARTVGTTDRTLRAFRKTGKVRRDIFDAIAKGMGTTREALLKPER